MSSWTGVSEGQSVLAYMQYWCISCQEGRWTFRWRNSGSRSRRVEEEEHAGVSCPWSSHPLCVSCLLHTSPACLSGAAKAKEYEEQEAQADAAPPHEPPAASPEDAEKALKVGTRMAR